jgi:hypothetical protein
LTVPFPPDGNLYVGTSASELLHFFRIPPDPNDPSGSAAFILASRLPPLYSEPAGAPNGSLPGVQQILLLPRVGKACVLCNWTVTFYSLPELSPVFGATQVRNCNWIGGVDLNEGAGDARNERSNGVTILLSLNRRIQVVRIGEEDARVVRVSCVSRLPSRGGSLTSFPENRLRWEHAFGTQGFYRMRRRFKKLCFAGC